MGTTTGWRQITAGWYGYTNTAGKTLAYVMREGRAWAVTVLPMADAEQRVKLSERARTIKDAQQVAESAYRSLTKSALARQDKALSVHENEGETMDASSAAEQMADLINKIEKAGLQITLSRGLVLVEDVRVAVGRYVGDPWAVETRSMEVPAAGPEISKSPEPEAPRVPGLAPSTPRTV
ncbi:hypothetical protein ACFZAM_31840 [Streptomyces sp. NPDC008079]|uniref:hypothetical protein n=1 Tax=Streptomyces sp. NPDC008079 TaxID=3364806 RepID=UPI0036EC3A45